MTNLDGVAKVHAAEDPSEPSLFSERVEVIVVTRDAGNRRGCRVKAVMLAEVPLQHSRTSRLDDAVCCGVLRVWRGREKWRPSRIDVRARIVVEICIADRGDRPPEKVRVLGVEHARCRVSQRQVQQREQPCVRQQISTVSGDFRPGDSIQLKLGEFGMPTRSLVIDC